MEDISRELEREIARAKPTPYKTSRKTRVLVVDDFGELKSGAYLRVLVYLFSIASLVGILAAFGFYTLYTNRAQENKALKDSVAALEIKTDQLTKDKEILMARLVMSGKEPGLESAVATLDPKSDKSQGERSGNPVVKTAGVKTKLDLKSKPNGKAQPAVSEPMALESETEIDRVPEIGAPASAKAVMNEPEKKAGQAGGSDMPDMVAVDKFKVVRGQGTDELIIRFDIRNIKKEPGGISGRIFAVLEPGSTSDEKWLVVPKAPVENGVPTVHTRGQYFSISRFKPVKFTVNSSAAPDRFKKASVYIFSDAGKLVFRNRIDVDSEESD